MVVYIFQTDPQEWSDWRRWGHWIGEVDGRRRETTSLSRSFWRRRAAVMGEEIRRIRRAMKGGGGGECASFARRKRLERWEVNNDLWEKEGDEVKKKKVKCANFARRNVFVSVASSKQCRDYDRKRKRGGGWRITGVVKSANVSGIWDVFEGDSRGAAWDHAIRKGEEGRWLLKVEVRCAILDRVEGREFPKNTHEFNQITPQFHLNSIPFLSFSFLTLELLRVPINEAC